MKRTCLQRNTNTDEQNSCEFHPVEDLSKEFVYNPDVNKQVKSSEWMKNPGSFLVSLYSPFRGLGGSIKALISLVSGLLSAFLVAWLKKKWDKNVVKGINND